MVPVVTAVVSRSVARRAIAAVLRGGRVSSEAAHTISRLALDTRTALRLIVGLGHRTVTLAAALELSERLSEVGIHTSPDDLARAWRTAYAVLDRHGHLRQPDVLTDKAATKSGAVGAHELRENEPGIASLQCGLLHLLGAEAEDLLVADRTPRLAA